MSEPVTKKAKASSKRAALPGASELFRPTRPAPDTDAAPEAAQLAASGRVKHTQKITVYFSDDELLALEEAKLQLRRHGVKADRGRLVRTAVALALRDFAERGPDGALVQELT
ncbi:hypothetical protein [Tessaracoccus caeni]|uniref:hypothetical protein n=1 Tax=Tessaracoccus caeni TaxID=3031239 RepID=UPI0023DABACF|nr:hypothetical protein [Tessaracoccus caeni]MDF1488018.1 hypothetical protein [Tessaracoccus caeni]